MYICPVCKCKFESEVEIAKHLLPCWKKNNPHHKSKEAPHSETITEREVSQDALNFFASLQERK